MSLVNSNVHRVATKCLADYPVVFTEPKGLSAFLEHRALLAPGQSISPRDMLSMAGTPGVIRSVFHDHYMCALVAMPVSLAKDFEFSADQKFYVAGQGVVGRDVLQVDQQILTMKQVAEKLREAGVPKDAHDIRLISGYSADAKRVPNLATEHLDAYSQAHTVKRHWFGVPLASTKQQAPAAHLLDALRGQGFDKAVVTGYHGAAVYDDGKPFPRSALRNANTAVSPDFDKTAAVRRSTVAHRFTSEVD